MPKYPVYTFTQLERILNTKIHGRLANLNVSDTNIERDLINSAVRISLTDMDFEGMKREKVLTPNLMDNEFDYALPTDAAAHTIIDFRPQNTDSRGEFETYDRVTPEEFDRMKKLEKGIFTVISNDLTETLRVAADVEDQTQTVSTLDNINDQDTWVSFDSTSVNDSDVKTDADDFIEGNGAIRFQTDTTDSTDSVVGIQNKGLTAFDISSYLARGSAFVDAKLTVADTGIHQFSMRFGSDSNNYYQISDSSQNDCSTFVTGWNKLRVDFANKTKVGSPTDTAITYAALYWSRDTTTTALLHLNDTDWGFDHLILKRGKYYLISYYSRYAWMDTAFALAENSSHDSYALMVDNHELEVVMAKAAELASNFLRDENDEKKYANNYKELMQEHNMSHPSESNTLTVSYYKLGSINDPPTRNDS